MTACCWGWNHLTFIFSSSSERRCTSLVSSCIFLLASALARWSLHRFRLVSTGLVFCITKASFELCMSWCTLFYAASTVCSWIASFRASFRVAGIFRIKRSWTEGDTMPWMNWFLNTFCRSSELHEGYILSPNIRRAPAYSTSCSPNPWVLVCSWCCHLSLFPFVENWWRSLHYRSIISRFQQS